MTPERIVGYSNNSKLQVQMEGIMLIGVVIEIFQNYNLTKAIGNGLAEKILLTQIGQMVSQMEQRERLLS